MESFADESVQLNNYEILMRRIPAGVRRFIGRLSFTARKSGILTFRCEGARNWAEKNRKMKKEAVT